MILPNFYHLGLLIWCALSIVIHAYDLSKRLEPQGPLGVRLDYQLATTYPIDINNKAKQIRRTFLWSSHLKFMEPVSQISDGQLWQMAHDAYNEDDNRDGAVWCQTKQRQIYRLRFSCFWERSYSIFLGKGSRNVCL